MNELTPDLIRWMADFTGINIEPDQSPARNQGSRAAATPPEADSRQAETPAVPMFAAPIHQGVAEAVVAGDEKNPSGEKSSQEAPGGEKSEEAPGGEKEGHSGVAETIVTVFKFLDTKSNDVTLKAPESGSAMPEGKKAEDFIWKGPIATTAVYDELTLLGNAADALGLEASDHLALAHVEVSFYYSGKYIKSFHAELAKAGVDRLASLECELTVGDTNVGNSPDHVAHIDWTVTFRRRHFLGAVTARVTGRASGDGTYTTSQPSIIDIIKEDSQQREAMQAHDK